MGASVSLSLVARHPDWEVLALDNLERRGSELNVGRLRDAGVEFIQGDVRDPADLAAIGSIDALVECSAEPSALAGLDGDPTYLVHTNLLGAYNCAELARRNEAQLVFLSTSRVYPYARLGSVAYEEAETRFELAPEQDIEGVSREGISERFPLAGARTLYGATKLAAEHLITEYVESFGLRAVIDRCSVIAGPWQMGRVDQGVFAYWMLGHYFRWPLSYIGYGGSGKQVRDLLHVDDLVELVEEQLLAPERWKGVTVNVGGGRERSLSLLEATQICRELTGNEVEIGSVTEPRPGDVPIYLSDCELLYTQTRWRPRRGAREVLDDLFRWISRHGESLCDTLSA